MKMYKGYELRGGSGKWEATDGSLCCGRGRTRDAAIAACRKEERNQREEDELSRREEAAHSGRMI